MVDKIAVVTGATGGIGRWIARGLAQSDYHVVMIARNQERGMAAQKWIKTELRGASTEIMLADLSLLTETRALAQQILAKHSKLSLLVNNAGIFSTKHEITSEGHEKVLAVNHLSPFVLAKELQPVILAAGKARIVTIGSDTSDRAGIDPDNLELKQGWNMVRAYSRSKLAQMMTTFETARRLKETGVTANVVHPGAVATDLVRAPGIIGKAWQFMAPFLLTEVEGANIPLYVALAPELKGQTGLYFKKRGSVKPNRRALDQALVARVWAATETLI